MIRIYTRSDTQHRGLKFGHSLVQNVVPSFIEVSLINERTDNRIVLSYLKKDLLKII